MLFYSIKIPLLLFDEEGLFLLPESFKRHTYKSFYHQGPYHAPHRNLNAPLYSFSFIGFGYIERVERKFKKTRII